MIRCNHCEEGAECCDFCKFVIHGIIFENGKSIEAGPIGCSLHEDERHQEIACGCGYCDDFHCKGTDKYGVKV